MRAIYLEDNLVLIKGSPLTSLYYKREFNRRLHEDLFSFINKSETGTPLEEQDYLNAMQIVWALAKTAADSKLVNFDRWLEGFTDLNLSESIADVVTEALNATYVGNPKTETDSEEEQPVTNFEITILVMAKRAGLSFDELNQLTLKEFIEFANKLTGKQPDELPRKATQADIDNFYLTM